VNPESLKRHSAASAVRQVESGMTLGLGTGSTIQHFLELLAEEIQGGRLTDIVGVPTSLRTEQSCEELGIGLTTLSSSPRLDLAVDGADEVDPNLTLIKGLGGALLREKMVAQASERFAVIADAGKQVDRLGTRSPLPVEVVEFQWQAHEPFLSELGSRPELRRSSDGEPYRTDNGNFIMDCRFEGGIVDPAALDRALNDRAGIVEHGLFLGLATEAHIAAEGGVQRIVGGI
jgi:ribose 5-phosphate isomerase A